MKPNQNAFFSESARGTQRASAGVSAPPKPPLDIPRVLKRIAELTEYTERAASGRDLVLVVGNTGSGKSTFVNYMAGCRMREIDVNGGLEVGIDAENAIMEIGHGRESLTSEPQTYTDRATGLTYCDCPGFFDNRGPEFDITNAYAIKAMLEKARSIKGVVVLVNYHSLQADKARGLRDTSNILIQLLGIHLDDIQRFRESILILVTKGQSEPEFTVDQLKEFLAEAKDPIITSMLERVSYYDPLDRPEHVARGAYPKLQIIDKLKNAPGINDNTGQLFGFALGHQSLNTLNSLVVYLAYEIQQQFSSRNYAEVNKLLTPLDQLRILPSSKITEGFNRICDTIRTYIRTLEGSNDSLPLLQKIKQEISYFSNESDASIKVVQERITAEKARDEARKCAEKAKNAEETKRDAAIKDAQAAEKRAGQAQIAKDQAESNAKSLHEEAEKKERELQDVRNRVEVREIHHYHECGGGGGGCTLM